jgi:hypothetical protein
MEALIMNKELNFSKRTIKEYATKYIESYTEKFGERPESWFTFLRWLASFTPAGNFDDSDIQYAKAALRQLI